ncbi:MAG TPA: hypothetical protein VF911_12410, partial [Thermoanaerobaculia bacterium]
MGSPEVSMSRFGKCCAIVILLFASIAAADEALPPLQLTISDTTVAVGNVTPGGDVVIFVASVENAGGHFLHRGGAKAFRDDDRDGLVTTGDTRPVPFRSIWVAIDVETGRSAAATPAGFPLQSSPLGPELLDEGSEGVTAVSDLSQRNADMLVVRPKDGAWRLRAHEGGNGDGDQSSNGKLRLNA